MAERIYFTPKLFAFLKDLEKNNAREWFRENKSRYERDVREPLLRFISDFGEPLDTISSHFLADPRPTGGSMFRINRDTRFSKDKRPYKTHAAAQFRHSRGKDVHAPCFYLHLEPGNVFAGAGIWHPDSKTLGTIRDAIAGDPARWKRIVSERTFKKQCTFEGDSLKRPPRGYDSEHPLIEDLKRKDFVVGRGFTQKQACAPGFMHLFTEFCRSSAPLVKFLTDALGLRW